MQKERETENIIYERVKSWRNSNALILISHICAGRERLKEEENL
jgi:hypothetical protein